ncbi:MAG: redoxin, partial [Deltaproteobacteria bacterium]|nr:redoxin [Deltaproteobacteria bacterium]
MLRLVVLSSFIGLASLWAAGEQVLDLDFVDLEGRVHHLSEFHKAPALIVAAFRHNCPVSLKSLPSLVRLSKENPTVPLIIVNTSDEASSETLRGALRRAGFSGIVAPDTNHSLGKALAIRSSTETFVLDGARTIRYRGPIHDQYGLGTARATVTKEYLKEALQDVLAGRRVRTQEVEAPGCHLNYSDAKPPSQHRIEYYPRLARIIQDRCEACHRQGEAGPMAFTRYEEVKDNREMIKFVVESGIMPPWFPHAGSGPFENDHSLTQSEKADLLAWIEAGTPEGDKALAPVPIRWPTGWTLGTPDSILKIPRAKVPAEGKIPYRYVELPTQFSED